MRKFILLFLLGISPLTFSYESYEDARGRMTCNVKSTELIEHIEGITTKYNSYSDGIKPGDSVEIEYGLFFGKSSFNIKVGNESKSYSASSLTSYFRKSPSSHSKLDFKTPYSSIRFGENKISGEYLGYTLLLNRYYKSDWSGIIIDLSREDTMLEILTLDCRQDKDDIGLISKYVYDILK